MLKLATPEQIQFYENILYPMQDEIFSLIQSDKFYLTGGTCLSRFYFNHKYSDDLDFFFLGNQFSQNEFYVEFIKILERVKASFTDVKLVINTEYFKRLFVFKNNTELKIEFIYEPSAIIGERILKDSIYIDTLDNVVTNKITAIQGRRTYKDYFDLFFLMNQYNISQVMEWAELKMMPLNYEGMLLSLTADDGLRGDVFMIREISFPDFKAFEEKLIKDLLNHAKTIP